MYKNLYHMNLKELETHIENLSIYMTNTEYNILSEMQHPNVELARLGQLNQQYSELYTAKVAAIKARDFRMEEEDLTKTLQTCINAEAEVRYQYMLAIFFGNAAKIKALHADFIGTCKATSTACEKLQKLHQRRAKMFW